LLSNGWVIGIIGGLISSFVAAYFNDLRKSRRERKEIRQRIQIANNEIINSIRPLIAKKEATQPAHIDSLLRSTARKHDLNKEDLHSVSTLADDIITEIMDNAFLSPRQKTEYCKFASSIKDEASNTGSSDGPLPATPDGQSMTERASFRVKARKDFSLILGATTFSSVLLGILSLNLGTGSVSFNQETLKNSLWIMAAAIIIPTFFFWIIDFYKGIRDLKRVQVEAKRGGAVTVVKPNEKKSEKQ
jgi:hypothetical protein